MRTLKDWLMGRCAKPEDVPSGADMDDGGDTESLSVRPVRMVEPIRLETTPEQHMELLRAVGATDRTKAELIRAALTLALPTLISNPAMIDMLQPGGQADHDGLASDVQPRPGCPGISGNGRGR